MARANCGRAEEVAAVRKAEEACAGAVARTRLNMVVILGKLVIASLVLVSVLR